MLYRVKVERLEPSTLYTKYKVHITRLGVKACEWKHYYSYLAGKMTTAK